MEFLLNLRYITIEQFKELDELTDKISINFPDFIENILSKTKDDMIDRFGISYIINYMLNTQPRKLDFLINEVK